MIRQTLQRLAPVIGRRRTDALWLAYHTEDDAARRRELEGAIQILAACHLGETCREVQLLLPPPTPAQAEGEYCRGTVFYGHRSLHPFGLREAELTQHLGIYGRTGAGKTNIVLHLLHNLIEHDRPFLVFDWKQNYRSLLLRHPRSGIRVFTVGSPAVPLAFNPLDLAEIHPDHRASYLREVVSVLVSVYFRDLTLLSVEGVEYLLLRATDDLLRSGSPLRFQSVHDWTTLHKGTFREKDWKSSLLNVLYKVTTGPVGTVLNAPRSPSLADLLSHKTVLELNWLGSPKDKAFFIQLLLLRLYHHCLEHPVSERLRLEVVIEEAHNVLLRHASRETVAEMVLRQIRELGVGVCLTDQHPHLISVPALGTYGTISLNLKAEQDVRAMGAAMLLDEDQRQHLGRLPVGWGVVKLQDRFADPFLVQFPQAQEHTPVPDSELVALMKGRVLEATCDAVVPPEDPPSVSEAVTSQTSVASREERFLIDVAEHPLSGTVDRYDRLGLSTGRGSRIQRKLLENGLVTSQVVSNGNGGVKLHQLTEEGAARLGRAVGFSGRLGGLLHRFWVDTIARGLEEKGYRVTKEFGIGEGKAVDLLAERADERLAVEVETGASDMLANIRKAQEAGFTKVLSVVPDTDAKDLLASELAAPPVGSDVARVLTFREMVTTDPDTPAGCSLYRPPSMD